MFCVMFSLKNSLQLSKTVGKVLIVNKIGGNIIAQLQVKNGTIKNEIGEKVPQWETAHNLRGWLDLSNGDSKYMTYDAKIQ